MKRLLLLLPVLAVTSCGSMKEMMDKVSGKVSPDGEKVKVVYAEAGNEFIDEPFEVKQLPGIFNKCKVVGSTEKIPFRGGYQYYDKLVEISENSLRNAAGAKKANTIVPTFRDVEIQNNGELIVGQVSGKILNCPEEIRKCSLAGDCSYKNTHEQFVTRTWAPVGKDKMTLGDENLAMDVNIGNDAFAMFFNVQNKTSKAIKIDSAEIVASGPYGRNVSLTMYGDSELDPNSQQEMSAKFNLGQSALCGNVAGRVMYGKAVQSLDDRHCVGEKFDLRVKYRIGEGARSTISLPFKLVSRVPEKQ